MPLNLFQIVDIADNRGSEPINWPRLLIVDSPNHQRYAVVCDDEQFSRALVGSVVEQLGYEVITCSTANDAISLAKEVDPDVLVIDLNLGPGPTGIEVIQHIQEQAPWTACVILTGHRSPRLVRKDLPDRLPGVAYLVKSELRSAADLETAIQSAIGGLDETDSLSQRADDDVAKITAQQADLLRMISDGLSNEDIAARRECSMRSAERMVVRLYSSLGISSSGGNARVIAAGMYRDGKVAIK